MEIDDSDIDASEATADGVAKVALRLFAILVLGIILIALVYVVAADYVAELSVSVDEEIQPQYAAAASYAIQREIAAFDRNYVNEPGEVKREVWTGLIWADGVLRGHVGTTQYIVEYKVYFADGEDVENQVTRIQYGEMDFELPTELRVGYAAPFDEAKLARLATAEPREWRNRDGEVFIEEGRLIYEFKGRIRIKTGPSTFRIAPIFEFSAEDQAYIHALVRGEDSPGSKVP